MADIAATYVATRRYVHAALPAIRRTPTLGPELLAVRDRRGLSARDVAVMTGLSASVVTAVERGERYPTLETLEALCSALWVTITIGPRETTIDPLM
jgi:transcriptional regulator with XRE-family HTH domain